MATRGGTTAKVRADSGRIPDSVIRSRTVGYMDKLIYRLIVGLACLILAIVLIITPILAKMFIDMDRREKRMGVLERKLQNKIEQIEQPKEEP